MVDFKKSVVYQIYPKSFNDSNGDGLGDLKGVTEKIGYLKELGVDYIWLTPFYISPQKDNGYDVEDYYKIDPRFGTMSDFEELARISEENGIKIMLDMVFNHTSTEHQWFKKAMNGDKEYQDFYILKDPKEGKEPTNWISKFGGNAWEYVEDFDSYYLHLFDVTQADLNWGNKKVREEIYKIVNFWIDKGVQGFRLDVINLISKPEKYEDDHIGDGRRFYTDGPKIHEYLKELNRETFGKHKDVLTVGEMSSTSIDNCIKYSNPQEKELSMVFSFHHLKVDYKDGEKWSKMEFDFSELKRILSTWQKEMHEGGGWNALFWCNHDQPRIVSRFGNDEEYHKESSKMLATTIHMMKGTPYIYQGEEIGMTNPKFQSIEKYNDVESINMFNMLKSKGIKKEDIMEIIQMKSRDNSRTPVQWNGEVNSGFTTGTPWLSVCENYKTINVEEAIKDKDSVLHHYKKLIALRKQKDIIAYGDYKLLLKDHNRVFAYEREYNEEKLIVMNNFYGEDVEVDFPMGKEHSEYEVEILISNYSDSKVNMERIILRPYESIVYQLVKK